MCPGEGNGGRGKGGGGCGVLNVGPFVHARTQPTVTHPCRPLLLCPLQLNSTVPARAIEGEVGMEPLAPHIGEAEPAGPTAAGTTAGAAVPLPGPLDVLATGSPALAHTTPHTSPGTHPACTHSHTHTDLCMWCASCKGSHVRQLSLLAVLSDCLVAGVLAARRRWGSARTSHAGVNGSPGVEAGFWEE